jgi:hypothetical protein
MVNKEIFLVTLSVKKKTHLELREVVGEVRDVLEDVPAAAAGELLLGRLGLPAGDDFAAGAKEDFNSISLRCGGGVMATGAGATTTVAVSIDRSTVSRKQDRDD